ncbi:DNA-damage-inducible protein J [Acidithiobacillus sp. GGI-221]|nr:DNA-damage-inducible protein J [Acidithiobacillus sp. GGI-221]
MSTTTDTYVRARIDTNTKERAASALEAMGLSVSDAIRLLMLRIADEQRMPFHVKVPNATTKKAIAELEAGKGKKFTSVDDWRICMRTIDRSSAFKRDYKREAKGQHRATLDDTLRPVLVALATDQPLDA